ncbi:MAG TPA: molybdopterin oxidoreductase family protein [Acidimicrobiales bacterium]|nr:molybdopterin oxidoreductase family protein [Acidimicrobiales bacterium]
MTRTAFRTCPLCEAGCGLEIALRDGPDGEEVARIRGDQDDVFSKGYICPKGSTLKQLHEDPDRVRRPLVKRDGEFVEVGWDEAFEVIERGLLPVIEAHGRDACAAYLGNPSAHSLAGMLYARAVFKALGSRNIYTASTVDQRPKEISAALMFGGGLNVPIPDIDRTDHLLMLGANPFASNGSLATAPDWPGRLERLVERGRLVVVDPRRSRTAEMASEWVPVRPGSDGYLLMAMVQVLFSEDLVDLGPLAGLVTGLDEVRAVCEPFTPEVVAGSVGLEPDHIRRLARELAAAPSACVYGRIGTTTAEFGTITSWLIDVLNVLTGNLDRPGGAMFTRAAAGAANTRGKPRYGREVRLHRHASRVRGLPETMGELPVVALAEEIDTPGEGQIRALLTVAGNPVLSTPNGARLDAALDTLDFMVSVDIYVNETTRHADVILPSPSALQKDHYDIALLALAIRNVANYSEAVLPLGPDELDEWEVLARLALVLQGLGATADASLVDDLMVDGLISSSTGDETSPIHGRDPEEIKAALGDRRGPARIVDFMLRVGPYGEGFGRDPDGLSLDVLLANPHGVDLGALEPRLPDVLRTPDGMIALAPELLLADVERMRAGLDGRRDHRFVLVGRRHLRSNNSWMHNVNVLVKGKPRCTLQLHPDDAADLGLASGDPARVRSRVGEVIVPVEVTDGIRPGVVSIPHGWGHDRPGTRLGVAREHAGVNSNLLADEELFDVVSGNAVLNGIPVDVARA